MSDPRAASHAEADPVRARRVGFVSTRFAGTDGVSLETAKWARVLGDIGLECFYFAGQCDRAADRSWVVPEAFYRHPTIDAMNRLAYGQNGERRHDDENRHVGENGASDNGSGAARAGARAAGLTEQIHALRQMLKAELHAFAATYQLDLLVVENASSIPLNLPLGLAISEFIAETAIPTIAHHHDLHWERQRFLVNSVPDILAAAFPPAHPSIHHVVINSMQARELASRYGLTAAVIPNVMEFERAPTDRLVDPAEIRADLGIPPGALFLLQPTRVVPRKGIEHAIEFTRRLGRPATLVISHAAGDEGLEYERRVHEYADLLGVDVRFGSEVIGEHRGLTADGRRIHPLDEVYPAADFVTYPSVFEGFGNAFLEAVYHWRPILVNNYSTYEVDIGPRGFHIVRFDGFIDEATMSAARRVLDDPVLAATWASTNYELGLRHFSFTVLRRHLEALLLDCFGADVGVA